MDYQPANYTLQAVNPAQSIMQGIQGGLGIQQAQTEQAQQQLALAQQAQMQKDLAALASKPNPTASDYTGLMVRYPQLADKFKASYDTLNSAQQQEQLKNISPVYAALQTGNTEIANQVLDQQIDAYQNAGNAKGVQGAQLMKQWIAASPESAMHVIGAQMAATVPDKFGEIMANLSSSARSDATLPADVSKGKADAVKANVDAATAAAKAPFAGPQAQADLEKTQQEKAASELQGKIAQLDTQIAQANSETERGKLQLERDKQVQMLGQQAYERGQAVQTAMNSAQDALDTVGQIRDLPAFTDNTGPGTLAGKALKNVPGSGRKTLETYVDSLKSQLTFSNLMAAKQASPTGASGFGALQEAELKLLANMVGNLDTDSSGFPQQLDRVQKLLRRSLASGVANPNLPTTGGAFVANSPKYGLIDEGRINRILKEIPGMTRDGVLKFLQAGP